MVYSLLKLTAHRLIRFSSTVIPDSTDFNPIIDHIPISQLLTAAMSRQLTSLTRIPTVSSSLVELRNVTTTPPTTSHSAPAVCESISTDQPRPWMMVSQPERQSRARTRRVLPSTTSMQASEAQRSRSLPPLSRTAPATTTVVSSTAPIVAYTDASCVQGRASGIGIFFGDNHPLNTSKALSGPEHNSGIAEVIAAQTALANILEWKEYKGQPVVIRTDYMGVIDAMNNGNFGRFSGIYADLRRLAERFPSVTFEHVYGHDGERGNEMADGLARQAIRLRARSETPIGRRGERSRSRSRQGRSRSAVVKGRRTGVKRSPPKVSDPSKVPPPNRSRSRSRDRNRSKSRAEVIKGVQKGRTSSPGRSVRSMQRSERNEQKRRQRSQRSQRRSERNRGRDGRK
ncbi:hypothetical protein PFISCL1PPCAC_1916 [Pristionchus fissidentatus]|uniref:ribonuclease H n=1 Tax=Pristionchus fissidentatus TaxID=1538716 RepID=A0AAV5UWA8_9BILA|nr:hypothetical protein PFISCL1PPCAC_1916 [Pristionchus fissidentatus]